MSYRKMSVSKRGGNAQRATTYGPSKRNHEDHGPTATGLARQGVFTPTSLATLQRSIGNQAVQQVLAVQRKAQDGHDPGTGLMLTDEDFAPELQAELSGKIRMLDEPQSESESSSGGSASWYRQRREQKAKMDEQMKAQGRYWSKSRGKYRHKKNAKWMGEQAKGFIRSTQNAYKKDGIHAVLTERMARLGKAEKLMKKGNYRDAGPLIFKPVLRDASPKKIAKLTAVAPIIMARMAAENAKANRLKRQWNRHKGT